MEREDAQESPTCPAGYSLTDQASGPDIVAVTSCGMVFHCRVPTSQGEPFVCYDQQVWLARLFAFFFLTRTVRSSLMGQPSRLCARH